MAQYTYRFANLLSDSDLCELEVTDARFDRRIVQPGAFSGNIPIVNPDIRVQAQKIVPAKTVVHVYRDSEIWGTYIIWTARVRSSSRGAPVMELSGATLESWFDRRIVDVDQTYNNTDQFTIARGLIAQAQIGWFPYASSANLHITTGSNLSGVKRDRHYYVTDGASVGQRLQELAAVDNGFEYMINTYNDYSSNTRKRQFLMSNSFGNSSLEVVYTYPGNISTYDISYDATTAATAFWTRGDTIDDDVSGTSTPLMTAAPVLADDWLASAFPHLDKVVDYSSVNILDTLENYAAWWRDNHAGIVAVPVIEINPAAEFTLIPPSALGTTAQFLIEDEFFGHGDFSSENRIIGIEVTPPSRGAQEVIRFVIEQDIDPTDIGS